MPFRKTYSHTNTHKNAGMYRHSYSSKKKVDMTEGPLLGKILLFSLPLIATNLLQMLYNAADMMVVTLSGEGDAVGAIGMTGPYINLILNIFFGFAIGANVMVARHLGAKDDARAQRTTHTAISMSVIFGLVSALLGLLLSRSVLSLMGATGNLLELATRYCLFYCAGIPFVSLANYLISIFRAKGDTKTPLVILSISGVANVLLNLFFVLVCDMSVEGVALATSIANVLSVVMLTLRLSRDAGPCRFSFRKLCLDRQAFLDIFRIGLPAGIQGSLFSLSNMQIVSSIIKVNDLLAPVGSTYQPVVNGNAAAGNLEGFAYTAQNCLYQAAVTFTSQNVGARKPRRVFRIMLSCYLLGASVAAIFGVGMFLLRAPLLSLYSVAAAPAGTAEAVAYSAAVTRMLYVFLTYPIISFMEVGCGILRGLGKSLSSTVISLLGACGFRILWISLVFTAFPSLETIYLSYPLSWGLSGIVFCLYSVFLLRGMIKRQRQEEQVMECPAVV